MDLISLEELFRRDLSKVLSLLAQGKMEAHVARRMPLEKASKALGLLAPGEASGKVMPVPGPGKRKNPS